MIYNHGLHKLGMLQATSFQCLQVRTMFHVPRKVYNVELTALDQAVGLNHKLSCILVMLCSQFCLVCVDWCL